MVGPFQDLALGPDPADVNATLVTQLNTEPFTSSVGKLAPVLDAPSVSTESGSARGETCPPLSLEAGSDYGTSEIEVSGIACLDALPVVTEAIRGGDPPDGFSCEATPMPNGSEVDGMAHTVYECSGRDARISWRMY